jgi:hypothetical protein
MTTLTVWLLVSLGNTSYQQSRPTVTIERFATLEECQRVRKVIDGNLRPQMMCVQATVAR